MNAQKYDSLARLATKASTFANEVLEFAQGIPGDEIVSITGDANGLANDLTAMLNASTRDPEPQPVDTEADIAAKAHLAANPPKDT